MIFNYRAFHNDFYEYFIVFLKEIAYLLHYKQQLVLNETSCWFMIKPTNNHIKPDFHLQSHLSNKEVYAFVFHTS